MKKTVLKTSELQKIEFGILLFIKQVCKKHSIPFYLAYGTALGAVRHQGFIPWDDDIDITMFRDDFMRFKNAIEEEKNPNYKLLYTDTESDYSLPLPKVIDTRTVLHQLYQREKMPIGVYVDLFILDTVPDNRILRKRFTERQVFTTRLWLLAQNKLDKSGSLFKKICQRLLWCIGPRFFAIRLDINAQKYNSSNSSLCANVAYFPPSLNKVFSKAIFGKGTTVQFEGEEFLAPEKIHEYLKNLYGSYLDLPPVEDRVSNHDYEAFFKNG